MATREENIKKINDELEKLDDEQLEQVAGGIIHTLPRRNFASDEPKEYPTYPNGKPDPFSSVTIERRKI